MDNWIAVETNQLPPNNKPVFCLLKGKLPCVAFYTKCHETVYDPGDKDLEYDATSENTGDHYLKPGWYEECETPSGEYDSVFQSREVTHWQYASIPGEPAPQSDLSAALAREAKLREALELLWANHEHLRDDDFEIVINALSDTPPPVAIVPAGSVAVPVEELKDQASLLSPSNDSWGAVQRVYEWLLSHITAAKQKEAE